MTALKRHFSNIIILFMILFLTGGCVYYNTFYNAKKAFNEAETTRIKGQYRGARINTNLYERAIEKSLKVIEDHPNSSWYDDALFVLAVSYYYTEQPIKAERRFRELLANYANSQYVNESRIYLAKTKLKLREEENAMNIFAEIFKSDMKKEIKAEAAMGLGTFYFNNSNYDNSKQYFQAVRDSLGNDDEKKIAQRYLADASFHLFQFDEALTAYQQILGMDPDQDEIYHAYFQSALSSYNLMRIDDGMAYLDKLITNELYFDSLGVLQMTVARGYEYDNDIEQAASIYKDITESDAKRNTIAEAYYQLGLIYQFDYDDLAQAKEYYDKTAEMVRSTDIGKDALQRSSDIGKLEEYSRTLKIDSTTTQGMIDEAAFTQYQLAEIYWFKLEKPDTAILEMQYVVDSFPTAYDAPKALIALSKMYEEYNGDTSKAKELLNQVITDYPRSDFTGEALDLLGLKGTPADTGYPKYYISKAESFLADEDNVDSAKYYYQYIIDNYPESNYYLQAKFALIWIMDNYNNPGDSTVYYAYQQIVDSFPGTEWAKQATDLIKYNPPKHIEELDTTNQYSGDSTVYADGTVVGPDGQPVEDSTYIDPKEAVYVDVNGNNIELLPLEPMETKEPFEYPVEAYRFGWEGELYFQIFLDFSGEVADYILKIRSGNEDIDREASETVASMIFDVTRIPLELQGQWLVYKFRVYLPEHLR